MRRQVEPRTRGIRGVAADRWRLRYRRIIAWWAAPLAILFALLFHRPAAGPDTLLAIVLATHVAFRIVYALVNLPYATWSTRVSPHPRDRTLMSGARMTFGALGAVTVAWLMPAGGDRYVQVAMLLAAIATLILWGVVRLIPEAVPTQPPQASRRTVRRDLQAIGRNRPFLMLCAATFCATVAGAIIGHSVLYYFAHVLLDAPAGRRALAVMGVIGAIAVPLWTLLALRTDPRASWLAAAALALAPTLPVIVLPIGGLLLLQCVAAAAPRTRSLPQPTPHEPTTKRKSERTTQDTPVYGGPDARSLGPRAA